MRCQTVGHPLPRANLWRLALVLLASLAPAATGCGQTDDAVIPPEGERLNPPFPCETAAANKEAMEQSCDGIDNDCDGLTDAIVPVADHRCAVSGASGRCASGYWGCMPGGRVCIAPAAEAETWNGIDDDCNGTTDDVAAMGKRALRALILYPPYLAAEGFDDTVLSYSLQQAGIPFDSAVAESEWTASLDRLGDYSLVILPGYVAPYAFGWKDAKRAPQYEKMRAFVENGGVLVAYRPIQSVDDEGKADPDFADLFGIEASQKAPDIETVQVEAAAATRFFDSATERRLRVMPAGTTEPQDAFRYLAREGLPVTTLMEGFAGNNPLGAVALRRPLGKGAVYSLGHDLLGFPDVRCYVNCFDPGRDAGLLLLAGMFREANAGHEAVLHTVPGPEPAAILVSHDIDAPDAFRSGDHGGPGARRMAEMEQKQGIQGTFFITSDYVQGYWRPALITELMARHVGAIGGHSVQHLFWHDFPDGDCSVSAANYNPAQPTACGEIHVNRALVEPLLQGQYPFRSWRTPYLNQHKSQFKLLAQQGFQEDSSIAVGDLRTSLPIWLPQFPFHHDWLFYQPLVELPLSIEDGLGWQKPDGTYGRLEIGPATWKSFQRRWHETLLEQSRNGSWTTVLVHPSMGVSNGPENVQLKINAVQWLIEQAKSLGLHFATAPEAGDFWKARAHANMYAEWQGDRYDVRLVLGEYTAPVIALRFGDRISSVSATNTFGEAVDVQAEGNIVLVKNAAVGSQIRLTAVVGQ